MYQTHPDDLKWHELLKEADKNNDGVISKEEFAGAI